MEEKLKDNVYILKLSKDLYNKLLSHNINTIYELCNYSRMELTELKFENYEINDLIVKLQLIGLDLKSNHAKRNTLLDSI